MKKLKSAREIEEMTLAGVRKYTNCAGVDRVKILKSQPGPWQVELTCRSTVTKESAGKCLAHARAITELLARQYDLSDDVPLSRPLPLRLAPHSPPASLHTLADAEAFLRSQKPDHDAPVIWASAGRAIEAAKDEPTAPRISFATEQMQEALQSYGLFGEVA